MSPRPRPPLGAKFPSHRSSRSAASRRRGSCMLAAALLAKGGARRLPALRRRRSRTWPPDPRGRDALRRRPTRPPRSRPSGARSCRDRGSAPFLDHGFRDEFPAQANPAGRPARLPSAPRGRPFPHEPAREGCVRRLPRRSQHGDRPTAVGDRDPLTVRDPSQIPAEAVLQLPHPNRRHCSYTIPSMRPRGNIGLVGRAPRVRGGGTR